MIKYILKIILCTHLVINFLYPITVITKSGEEIEGKIVNEDSENVIIKINYGKVTIPKKSIVKILGLISKQMDQADTYFNEQNFDKALLLYKQEYADKPDSKILRKIKSSYYEKLLNDRIEIIKKEKDLDRKIILYQKAIDEFYDSVFLEFKKAELIRLYLDNGQIENAKNLIKQLNNKNKYAMLIEQNDVILKKFELIKNFLNDTKKQKWSYKKISLINQYANELETVYNQSNVTFIKRISFLLLLDLYLASAEYKKIVSKLNLIFESADFTDEEIISLYLKYSKELIAVNSSFQSQLYESFVKKYTNSNNREYAFYFQKLLYHHYLKTNNYRLANPAFIELTKFFHIDELCTYQINHIQFCIKLKKYKDSQEYINDLLERTKTFPPNQKLFIAEQLQYLEIVIDYMLKNYSNALVKIENFILKNKSSKNLENVKKLRKEIDERQTKKNN